MTITIYGLDANAPFRTVCMTLDILGLKANKVEVNNVRGDHLKPEYQEKNPIGTIPMLEDDGLYLSQSQAIIVHLATKYGGPKADEIYPSDLTLRSKIHQFLFIDASLFFPRIRVVGTDLKKGESVGPNEKQSAELEESFGFLEAFLKDNKYLVGDRVTLADIACVSTMSTIDILYPIGKKYVKIHEWWNRLKKESWYQRCNEPGLVELRGMINEWIERNAKKLKSK